MSFLGASKKPTDLLISNLTTVSAEVSWLPADSSLTHTIYLNSVIFYRVKPGVVTCKLRELLANKEYVVTIQAMTAQIHYDLKKSSASVSFKTPEGGMN